MPGRLWTRRRRKTPTMRTPTPTDTPTPCPARAQVSTVAAISFIFISFHSASPLTKRLIFPPPPQLIHPPPRCSDFLLLPQTPAHPILLQERHASLRRMAARHRPPTVPWAPAAAACSVEGLHLIMTHIHPRPIHLLYPVTARVPSWRRRRKRGRMGTRNSWLL